MRCATTPSRPSPTGPELILTLAVAMGVLALGPLATLFAEGPETSTPPVDVLIVVSSPGPGVRDEVAITYAHPVRQEEMFNDIRTLVREGQWETIGYQVDLESGPGVGPAVSFRSHDVVVRDANALLITPFIRAFARYRRVRLTYLVQGSLAALGPVDYETTCVRVRLRRGQGTFDYDILFKRSDCEDVSPPAGTPPAPVQAPAQQGLGQRYPVVFFSALLMMTGLTLGLTYRYARRVRAIRADCGLLETVTRVDRLPPSSEASPDERSP